MEGITYKFLDNGNLVLERLSNRNLIFRNFSGAKDRFNSKGERKFTVVIPWEFAQDIKDKGWDVKIKPPREDGEDPFCTLSVKVRFDLSWAKPWIMQVTRRGGIAVDENNISNFDRLTFEDVALTLRPNYYEKASGERAISAQLAEMIGTIREGYLESMWNEEGPGEDEAPFGI